MIQLIGSELYQWELGRQVKLNAPNLEVIPELHFIDYKSPNCIVVEHKMVDGEIIYDIPNILLQQTRGVFIYIVQIIGDCKEVIGTANFKIKPKQKSPNYVYTETEIKSYEALEERVAALENGSGTGGNVDLSEIEEDIENLQLDAAIMSGELDELETTVGQLSEEISNLNIPTVDDILNALPTWQGGAY